MDEEKRGEILQQSVASAEATEGDEISWSPLMLEVLAATYEKLGMGGHVGALVDTQEAGFRRIQEFLQRIEDEGFSARFTTLRDVLNAVMYEVFGESFFPTPGAKVAIPIYRTSDRDFSEQRGLFRLHFVDSDYVCLYVQFGDKISEAKFPWKDLGKKWFGEHEIAAYHFGVSQASVRVSQQEKRPGELAEADLSLEDVLLRDGCIRPEFDGEGFLIPPSFKGPFFTQVQIAGCGKQGLFLKDGVYIPPSMKFSNERVAAHYYQLLGKGLVIPLSSRPKQ